MNAMFTDMSEAVVVDGEASESEDESSEEINSHVRSFSTESKLSMAGFSQSFSSVTATVEKHIGALSRQATKDLDNITKGQLRRSATQDSCNSDDGPIKSPSHTSLLHKKLHEKNTSLLNHATSFFQELFARNDNELKKVNEDMINTRIYLQDSTIAMQHSAHYCSELADSLKILNTTMKNTRFPTMTVLSGQTVVNKSL
jgi:hypothetical protein